MIKLPINKIKIKLPKKDKTDTTKGYSFLALEVDSGELRVGVYNYHENKLTLVSKCNKKVDYNLEESLLNNETLSMSKNCLKEALDMYQDNVKDVIVGISQNNVYSITTTVRVKRVNSESKITKQEVTNLTEKIIEKAKSQILDSLKLSSNLQLLNSDISLVKIDGYISKSPEGFKGSSLEISLFTSFIESSYLENISDLISDLGLNLITVTTSNYSLVKTLNNGEGANFTLIDLDTDTTNLAVIFGGEMFYGTSTLLGFNSMIKYIAKLKDEDFETTHNKFKNEEANSEEMQDYLDIWASYVAYKFKQLEMVKVFPEQVLFVSPYSKSFDKRELAGRLIDLNFKNTPKISTLSIESFEDFEDHTKTLKENEYIKNIGLAKFLLKIKNGKNN